MLQDLALALRLQALDRKIASLENGIAILPKHIAEIEKKLEAHMRRLEGDRAALAANQRERKTLDGDIQVHNQKVSKLRDQMLGAKTNEQYKAFQNEIALCRRRRSAKPKTKFSIDGAVRAARKERKSGGDPSQRRAKARRS